MKPKLNPPATKRLKLEYDGLLSNFGFKFNLRRYTVANLEAFLEIAKSGDPASQAGPRALHSSPSHLHLIRFCPRDLHLEPFTGAEVSAGLYGLFYFTKRCPRVCPRLVRDCLF